jgi:hypothetical protein
MGIFPSPRFYYGGFNMTLQTVEQFALFMVVFSISLGLSIYIFYVLKDKAINIFGSKELKEANKEFNRIVDEAPKKIKDMVKKNG